MIAKNLLRNPDALALQMPLPFGHGLKWATSRPGARILRTIRAARGKAFKLAGRTRAVVKAKVPDWYKAFKRRAKSLAITVKTALMTLI